MRPSRAVQVFAFVSLLTGGTAHAVPAFARQTGMACSSCHTVFPELTPMGRQFKAGGYTMSTTKQITEGGTEEKPRVSLELPFNIPLGVMAQIGYTHTAEPQQVGPVDAPRAKNDDISLPEQFSIFFAGKIAPVLGAFVQLTYSGPEGTIGLDNTDIRLAHSFDVGGTPLILGATINNSPTVTDLWNTTPAWGVPFSSSGSAPSPMAATLIEGALAQSVAGGGVYGFWNGNVYAEFNLYRSAPLGMKLPLDATTGATNVIDTVLPYWRVAGEKEFGKHSISVGTFGLHGVLLPGGEYTDDTTDPPTTATHPLVAPGDAYTDVGFDAQYQFLGDHHIITAMATYIYETSKLDASNAFGNADNAANELHSFKASLSYIYDRLVGGRFTVATMRGSSDATLYGGQGPRSTALTGEIFATPWQNSKLGLMYTGYLDFNGAAVNYDGNGRDAKANNTIYAYIWLAF